MSACQVPNPAFRWAALGLLLLALIIVPFLLWEAPMTAWTENFLGGNEAPWIIAAGLGGLLAADVVLPVPSSLVSTAAGYVLGLAGGALVSWTGMMAGCLVGYGIGRYGGRAATRRWVGDQEFERAGQAQLRYGDWVLVMFRAVPVLAEASVILTGATAMPLRRFLGLTALSNAAIAIVYAAVGAYALEWNSFLLAFAGSILLPALAMWASRRG